MMTGTRCIPESYAGPRKLDIYCYHRLQRVLGAAKNLLVEPELASRATGWLRAQVAG
jgi:hypothetical protein